MQIHPTKSIRHQNMYKTMKPYKSSESLQRKNSKLSNSSQQSRNANNNPYEMHLEQMYKDLSNSEIRLNQIINFDEFKSKISQTL